jgi:hypothetical protein
MVREIERFGSEFDRMFLPNPKLPRQAHVDLDKPRTQNSVSADIAKCAQGCLGKGRWVQPHDITLVWSGRAGKHLIWTLEKEYVDCLIDKGKERQVTTG